jgi:hypothetical protein
MAIPFLAALGGGALMRAAFGTRGAGQLFGGIKMGAGYTTGSYALYGFWNEFLDPFGIHSTSKFTQRGSSNISLGLTKYKKMPFYRRRMYGGYRRRYRRYRRFRRYRRYY